MEQQAKFNICRLQKFDSDMNQFLNKIPVMKTLKYLIALAIVVIAGCSKDYTADDIPAVPELRRANVPIPIKLDLSAVPDMESDLIFIPIPGNDPYDPASYLTSRFIISGNGTHLGKVDSNNSYYEITVIEFQEEDGMPFLFQSGPAILMGANGDYFEYIWWAKASLPDFNWVGEIEIQSGTGKFEGCSGSCDMAGYFDLVNLINFWNAEGFMVFN